jgi:hypothetical protein
VRNEDIDPADIDPAIMTMDDVEKAYRAIGSEYGIKQERVEVYVAYTFLPFKNLWLEGDEVHHFRTPAWTWGNLSGREGYCIIRNGIVVGHMITWRN